MPEDNRVFDVTRPGKVSPHAAGRPVIVDQNQPTNDPMVKEKASKPETSDKPLEPTRIKVDDGADLANGGITEPLGGAKEDNMAPPNITEGIGSAPGSDKSELAPMSPGIDRSEPRTSESAEPVGSSPASDSPAVFSESSAAEEKPAEEKPAETEEKPADSPPGEQASQAEESAAPGVPPEGSSAEAVPAAATDAPQNIEPLPQIEGLQVSPPMHRGKGLKIFILVLLALLVAAYLAIDSGLISTSINLPVHIFKQKETSPPVATQNTSSTTNNSSNNTNTVSVPSGFKLYTLAGTNVEFAAPTVWGAPTSTTDPGYSKRGGTNQSDGTYAYLVNFATNKDVQIAVTSDKYLPAARGTLYYDYLQWCTGTNDGKIYESTLHFTTTDKVDTPTTVTCDQGPVTNAEKLDNDTILQPKATDTNNQVIGDIYTKNLTDPSLVVLRVKDATMKNSDNIKQMLNTVKLSS